LLKDLSTSKRDFQKILKFFSYLWTNLASWVTLGWMNLDGNCAQRRIADPIA